MAEVEERVAYLEGRVEDHSQMVNGLRDALASLEARMDRRFEAMDRRFEAIDRRFEAIDRRFELIDRRFEAVDQRLETIDAKMSRQFVWLVGIQVTTLIAVAGGFAAVAGGFASIAAAIAAR
jgi:uncharacterized coiled-coil protein SlyX